MHCSLSAYGYWLLMDVSSGCSIDGILPFVTFSVLLAYNIAGNFFTCMIANNCQGSAHIINLKLLLTGTATCTKYCAR
jgi:hypothetical protein